jgi:probable HAF family extracellular repeat protein
MVFVNDNTSTSTPLAADSSGLNTASSDDYGLSLSTKQPSLLYYGGGNDVITALGDRPVNVFAGEGNNLVNTGSGNDVIYAGSGKNYIYAGDGNNSLFTGTGVNNILTGNGNDLIYAGGGSNTIYSGAGNDTIYAAGSGNNLINAGTGNDTVFIAGGKNRIILEAGEGAVTIFGFDVKSDKLRLGESLVGESLKFVSKGTDTLVKAGKDLLAVLKDVSKGSQALIDNGPLYRYQVTDLGSLSTNPNGAVVAGSINDFGQIAGRFDTGATFTNENATTGAIQTTNIVRQGFIWENGKLTALTSTGVKNGESDFGGADGETVTLLTPTVNTISNLGVILGTADEVRQPIPKATDRALVWEKDGSSYKLTINDFGGIESYSLETNNNNVIVGRNILSSGYEKTIYIEDGVINELAALGGDGGTARGINNQGQIVGYVDSDGTLDETFVNTAVIWEKDAEGVYQLKDFGSFGYEQATFRDINEVGQIIGSSSSGTGTTATSTPFVLRNDEFTDLGSLGGKTGSVNGINDFGQVVGASQIGSGTNHAYVWNNGLISDLNDLITTPLTYNGASVTLTSAVSVNNFGEIVATGTYTYKDAAGQNQTGTRSYVLKATV